MGRMVDGAYFKAGEVDNSLDDDPPYVLLKEGSEYNHPNSFYINCGRTNDRG
jgi:hypothetical protein